MFAGQRAETFYIDLGAVFDTLNLRRYPPLLSVAEDARRPSTRSAINRFANANINTIAIEVPIRCLTSDGKAPSTAEPLIGVYASTSRQKVRVLRDNGERGRRRTAGAGVADGRIRWSTS